MVILFLGLTLFAQAQKSVDIDVSVRVNIGTLDNISLTLTNDSTGETKVINGYEKTVYVNGSPVKNISFIKSIRLNQNFTLEFSKPNYVSKKITIDTHIPAEMKRKDFYPIRCGVILFPQPDSTNILVMDKPVLKYMFSEKTKQFEYILNSNQLTKP